jgi:hypothetical protein
MMLLSCYLEYRIENKKKTPPSKHIHPLLPARRNTEVGREIDRDRERGREEEREKVDE